jgi:poly(3-hydroxybutyrate) depolymerase
MRVAVLALLVLALAAVGADAADPLPAYAADPKGTTVSGISSGGYMAVQFHVAHSATVTGAGVLAAGPYYCAQGSVWTAYHNCMTPGTWTPLPSLLVLKSAAEVLAAGGAIDPTSHLASARVWLFSGTRDQTVAPAVVAALRAFYASFVPAESVRFVGDVPAGHAMVTTDAGAACDVTAPPFINDCDFDAAGRLLEHLYGALAPPSAAPAGRLVAFDQKPFAAGDAYGISMADTGFVYVPAACEAETCRTHVALHGCRQSVEAIGERFVRESGYNRWADANRIIVLYPQTIARNGPGYAGGRFSYVANPRGCWDWWGYSSPLYHTREGPQVRALKAMVDRLAAPRSKSPR